MEVKVLLEAGYEQALLGMGLSYGVVDQKRLEKIAEKLAPKDGGHNKFLESLIVWLDVTASRYWWAEADTYRVGTTKQSESTIHTITKKELTQGDFEGYILIETLEFLNKQIRKYNEADTIELKNTFFVSIKNNLPEGYKQKRMVCTNYKVLKNMFWQRKNHKLQDWRVFIEQIMSQIAHPEFLVSVLN